MAASERTEKTLPANGKILVMEEETSIRTLIERMMTQKGFEVVSAKDGTEAVHLYKIALEMHRPFDAVLLDLSVASGMGGVETMKHLVKIDPDVIGIVSSGYLFDDVIVNYSKYGFKKSITKPFSMSDLVSANNDVI